MICECTFCTKRKDNQCTLKEIRIDKSGACGSVTTLYDELLDMYNKKLSLDCDNYTTEDLEKVLGRK